MINKEVLVQFIYKPTKLTAKLFTVKNVVSLRTQVEPPLIPDPGCLRDYLSVSSDYEKTVNVSVSSLKIITWLYHRKSQ